MPNFDAVLVWFDDLIKPLPMELVLLGVIGTGGPLLLASILKWHSNRQARQLEKRKQQLRQRCWH